MVGRQHHATAAFTPRGIPGTHFLEAELAPGHRGFDPGTARLVAQWLRHCATSRTVPIVEVVVEKVVVVTVEVLVVVEQVVVIIIMTTISTCLYCFPPRPFTATKLQSYFMGCGKLFKMKTN